MVVITYAHTHTQHAFKIYSVKKIEWKETDGQTEASDCFALPANAVGNYFGHLLLVASPSYVHVCEHQGR